MDGVDQRLRDKAKDLATLKASVAMLDLRSEVCDMLIQLVKDPPPDNRNVNDALASMDIDPGRSSENKILKAIRVSLWALVYFPRQFIAYHKFMSWADAERLTEDSPRVQQFRKNKTKLKGKVDSLMLMNVTLITQNMIDSNPATINGFRLTVDGDDYTTIIEMDHRALGNKQRRYMANVSSERCDVEGIKNPVKKEFAIRSQKKAAALKESGSMAYFDATPDQIGLLTAGEGIGGGDNDEEEEDED